MCALVKYSTPTVTRPSTEDITKLQLLGELDPNFLAKIELVHSSKQENLKPAVITRSFQLVSVIGTTTNDGQKPGGSTSQVLPSSSKSDDRFDIKSSK